jgi:Tol biopolymer transport system component
MKRFLAIGLTLIGLTTQAQSGHEIYLADIEFTKTGITLFNPKNITNRKGYDNQPSFHPNKPLLYYSSFNDSSLAEIKSFNYKSNKTSHLTKTREHEYSPTVTPDKKFISCIIQRSNGAQDLIKFPIDGGSAQHG